MKHTPVFFEQTIDVLAIREGGKYIDGTAGEAGHLSEILARGGRVLALDYDADQVSRLRDTVSHDRLTLIHANFGDIAAVAKKHGFVPADGILLDLGLSMGQLSGRGNGLSYRFPDEPLDMRLGTAETTAADIVTEYPGDALADMLERNAEETNALAIARAIVDARERRPIRTVGELLVALGDTAPDEHSRARVFQALRIEVNDEIGNLRRALDASVDILAEGGRLVVITFHSLEDRIVKKFGKAESRLTEEKVKVHRNERRRFERSAQLRVFTKHSA